MVDVEQVEQMTPAWIFLRWLGDLWRRVDSKNTAHQGSSQNDSRLSDADYGLDRLWELGKEAGGLHVYARTGVEGLAAYLNPDFDWVRSEIRMPTWLIQRCIHLTGIGLDGRRVRRPSVAP